MGSGLNKLALGSEHPPTDLGVGPGLSPPMEQQYPKIRILTVENPLAGMQFHFAAAGPKGCRDRASAPGPPPGCLKIAVLDP